LAIFPRKVDFSCFGYHPDLESRLTFQEKWVLDHADAQLSSGARRELMNSRDFGSKLYS
ncbi:hypothetical protein ACVI7B_009021, partial [Bradyrhizobium elkanii]